MSHRVVPFKTKVGIVVARYKMTRVEGEVEERGERKTKTRSARSGGVLVSLELPDGRKVRRDENPKELLELAARLGIPPMVEERTVLACKSRECY